jgi:hypothetical protein
VPRCVVLFVVLIVVQPLPRGLPRATPVRAGFITRKNGPISKQVLSIVVQTRKLWSRPSVGCSQYRQQEGSSSRRSKADGVPCCNSSGPSWRQARRPPRGAANQPIHHRRHADNGGWYVQRRANHLNAIRASQTTDGMPPGAPARLLYQADHASLPM